MDEIETLTAEMKTAAEHGDWERVAELAEIAGSMEETDE